jgi:nucleotide-binding universal stress UspA family protein
MTQAAQILIPVANPATAPALVRLAAALAAGSPPAELVAVKIVTCPKGMPLDEARRYILGMREHYEGALAEARACAQQAHVDLAVELRVERDVAGGILAACRELPRLELVLLGWRGEMSRRRVRWSVNQEIVARAPCNVAVLLARGSQPICRVLVPVGWGPHARFGLRVAERLAQGTGAAVTAFRVLPMVGDVDWEAERVTFLDLMATEAPGLRYGTELQLVRAPAVVPAILAEVQRQPCDLLVIGASEGWWLRNWLFGAIPDQVAGRAPCSVLLVRRGTATAVEARPPLPGPA